MAIVYVRVNGSIQTAINGNIYKRPYHRGDQTIATVFARPALDCEVQLDSGDYVLLSERASGNGAYQVVVFKPVLFQFGQPLAEKDVDANAQPTIIPLDFTI